MDNMTLPIITIRERYFMQDGKRFIIKGVVYQRSARDGGSTDPLANEHIASIKRDIKVFSDLGLNALFVYKIDPDLSHDECMNALANAGIYVMALAVDPRNREVINRTQPRGSYSDKVQSHFRSAARCLARYCNTIGLCISSDLIINASARHQLVAETLQVLAQATRELKEDMQTRYAETGQRILPIGIADTFWSLTHTNSFDYLTGRDARNADPTQLLDFYCVNHYAPPEPINTNHTQTVQSDILPWNMIHTLPQFHNSTHVPILLSEYSGSNANRPRSFQETADLYNPTPPEGTPLPMLDVLSGGFVYEFFEHANQYGLVKLQSDKASIEELSDYEALKTKLSQIL